MSATTVEKPLPITKLHLRTWGFPISHRTSISPYPCPRHLNKSIQCRIRKQLTPHLLFKNILLQKEKNTMQYKRLTSSSSLLHNFQPIRKTNKSPTTGDGALTFWGLGFFFFLLLWGIKLKIMSLSKNKSGEKIILWVNSFSDILYVVFP